MNKIYGAIVILFFLFLILFLLRKDRSKQSSFLNATTKENIIHFKDINRKVYFRAANWGFSGSHDEIVLTQNKYTKKNNYTDYYFYTPTIFYKVEKNGTLIIFAPESSIKEPSKKFSDITIVIRKLKNANEISKYNMNYKDSGLEKICTH